MSAGPEGLVKVLAERLVLLPSVEHALSQVDRRVFLPAESAAVAYDDAAVVTATDADGMPVSSASQPAIVVQMLQALALEPGHRALEIGTGTGYNAALMKAMVGPAGTVTSVEVDAAIAASAGSNLSAAGFDVEVVAADGAAGVPDRAPFDRIVLTASTWELHADLLRQLAVGGVLVAPVRVARYLMFPQLIAVFERVSQDTLVTRSCFPGGFMIMRADSSESAWTGPVARTTFTSTTGQRDLMYELRGAGASSLDSFGMRALLACSTERQLDHPVQDGALYDLAIFIAFSLPDTSLMSTVGLSGLMTPFGADAIGCYEQDRNTVAALAGDGGTATAVITRGSDTAVAGRLLAIVDEWETRGRPSVRELTLTVDPTLGRTRDAWRVQRRGSAELAADWRSPGSGELG